MARRPKGVQTFINSDLTDQIIKTGPGIIYSAAFSWTGATVGDRVILYDGTDDTGTKKVEVILTAAAGKHVEAIAAVGRECLTGIFLNLQLTGSPTFKMAVDYD